MNLMGSGKLNDFWWFRLVSVGYYIAFAIALASVLLAVGLMNSKSIDHAQSYFECDDGTKISLLENNIRINSPQYLDIETERRLKSSCFKFDGRQEFDNISSKHLDRMEPNYKLFAVYDYDNSKSKIVLIASLAALAVIVLFEALRRIFYFIVLNKFFP